MSKGYCLIIKNLKKQPEFGCARGVIAYLLWVCLVDCGSVWLTADMPRVGRKKGSKARRTVPYARGFAPPTAKQRDRALNLQDLEEKLSRQLVPGKDGLFVPVPQPTSIDDWLAQYKEEGQTYAQFLSQCPWLSNRKVKYYKSTFVPNGRTLKEKYPRGKIYILPLNSTMDPPTELTPKFEDLADYTQRFYDVPVEVLPAIELQVDTKEKVLVWENDDQTTEEPSSRKRLRRRDSIRIRFHKETGHFQLKADTLLGKVKQVMPSDAICLMALTMMDVYLDEPDLFVAGLAAGNTRAGVFSLRRYDPSLEFSTEFWYDIAKVKSKGSPAESREAAQVMLQRSIKLLVHEIAHLLGIDHCIWYSCCMNGSGHLSEDFQQSMHLCPVDLRKLQHLCGFDIPSRYSRLKEFFAKHKLEEERLWIEKRLQSIGK